MVLQIKIDVIDMTHYSDTKRIPNWQLRVLRENSNGLILRTVFPTSARIEVV